MECTIFPTILDNYDRIPTHKYNPARQLVENTFRHNLFYETNRFLSSQEHIAKIFYFLIQICDI